MQIIMFVKQKRLLVTPLIHFENMLLFIFMLILLRLLFYALVWRYVMEFYMSVATHDNQLANRKLNGWGEISVFRIIYMVIYNCVKLKLWKKYHYLVVLCVSLK